MNSRNQPVTVSGKTRSSSCPQNTANDIAWQLERIYDEGFDLSIHHPKEPSFAKSRPHRIVAHSIEKLVTRTDGRDRLLVPDAPSESAPKI